MSVDPVPALKNAVRHHLGLSTNNAGPVLWPDASLPLSEQRVTIFCGGAHCTDRSREQLVGMPDTHVERIFREGSSFLGGASARWAGSAWEWHVLDTTRDDVPHVRRLLSITCPPQADAARRLRSADARVIQLATMWGMMKK